MIEEQLLQAIYDNPDSDDPRLALAEFLEQKNDPRGTHLRLACELAWYKEIGWGMCSTQIQRLQRLVEELPLYQFEFEKEGVNVRFARGFPDNLATTVSKFQDTHHMIEGDLFRTVTKLKLYQESEFPADIQPLLEMDAAKRFTRLDCSDCLTDDRFVKQLTKWPHLTNLTELKLGYAHAEGVWEGYIEEYDGLISDEVMQSLFSRKFPQMQTLDLSLHPISEEAMGRITEAVAGNEMTSVDFRDCKVNAGLAHFFREGPEKLKRLCITENSISDVEVDALREAKLLPHLRSLQLSCANTSEKSCASLICSERMPLLEVLSVCGHTFTKTTFNEILSADFFHHLITLQIAFEELSSTELIELTKQATSLTKLKLTVKDLERWEALKFLEWLQDQSLELVQLYTSSDWAKDVSKTQHELFRQSLRYDYESDEF